MKLRNRFLLVGFGVLVFLIATPILVLFTSGYKIDWQTKTLVKTGAFVIKTLPTKASVYLNNEKVKGVTPETVRFLLPGDYVLRLEKEGYQSWTKRLHIQAQLATWANFDRDFVTLFLSQPQQQHAESVNFASLSQTGDQIAYVQNGNLFIYNVANQSTQAFGDISSLSFPLTFSGNLHWSNGSALATFFLQHTINLPFSVESIGQVWADGQHLVLLSGNDLYIMQGDTVKLLDNSVQGALIDGENLWYVQNSALKDYNLRTNVAATAYTGLPQSTSATVVRGDGHTFLLLDSSLYVLNDTLEKIYDGVNFANYDANYHALLFANPNEILTYNPAQKTTDLILRSISPVSSPVLNSYTGYVFFANENKIKAIELDGRDHRNVYTIVELPTADNNIALNSNGDILTVFGNTVVTSYKIR